MNGMHMHTLPGQHARNSGSPRPGRLGEFPCFVRRATEQTPEKFASNLFELRTPTSKVDPLGLAVLLALGFQVSRRTVMDGVERVGASHQGDEDLVSRQQFAGFPSPSSRPPSRGEIVELAVHAIRKSMPSARPIVPLSGGKDSRLIFLGLRSLGVRPRVLLTAGSARHSVDALIARDIARQYSDLIEFVPSRAWSGDIERWRHAMTSFESLEHGWFVPVALRARSLGGPVTDGIGAGVLATGSLMKEEAVRLWKQGRMDELAEWTLQHAAGVGGEFFEEARRVGLPLASADEVRQEIVGALFALRNYPNPLGCFSLFHWTRRGIGASAFGLLGRENVIAPWMDFELCKSLLAIELDEAIQHDWRDDVLAALDRTGLPLAESLPPLRRRPWKSLQGGWAWRRYCSALPPQLRQLSAVCERTSGVRKTFGRAALSAMSMLLGASEPRSR